MNHTFLLVSDIHYRLDNIEKLRNWLIEKDRLMEIDFVIVSGDLVNANYVTPLTTEKDREEFHEVLFALEKLGKSVYYIPGNHDPDTSFLFSSDQGSVINVHNKIVQLSPGLSILGFGGSTDGVLKYSPETVVWPACPRNTESLLAEKLPILLDQVEEEVILVTHVGPAKIGTTNVEMFPLQEPSTSVEAGSPTIRKILESRSPLTPDSPPNCKVVVNIHGHSHYPFGLSHLGQTMIVNPGPLRDEILIALAFGFWKD
ncbi:455_t:CDS:2 [Acaulospora morrowiae]|uniref:455_t:CDS:1 n=1 Tax=Acaulospora morrowiae TaxID=94023 RepID=A0A9N9DWG7_9GLOM|nr:455_t:CDS:2 [Acaulospora morrowiae]